MNKKTEKQIGNAFQLLDKMIELKKLHLEELKILEKPLPLQFPKGGLGSPTNSTAKIIIKGVFPPKDSSVAETYKREHRIVSMIGTSFIAWADKYFKENRNKLLIYQQVYDDYEQFMRNFPPTMFTFKNKLKLYCELKGYLYNPKGVTMDIKERYMVYSHGIVTECIYVEDKVNRCYKNDRPCDCKGLCRENC